MPSWFKLHPIMTFIGFFVIIIIAAIVIGEFTKKKYTTPLPTYASASVHSRAPDVIRKSKFEQPEFADNRSDNQSDAAMACNLHRSDGQMQSIQTRLDSTTAGRKLQFSSGSNAYDELVTPE